MRMCVLASGSSGNCTVVRIGGRALLIDAGIGPRTAAKRLADTGTTLEDIDAILLTHLDHDHFKPTWFTTIRRLSIRVHVHRRHLHALYRSDEAEARATQRAGFLVELGDGPWTLTVGGETLTARTVHGPHDEAGVVSYRLEGPTGTLAFATDVGKVSEALVRAMTDVDLLAIESNYDGPMQIASSRPTYLKQRIMGGRGHLSNEQAFEAVRLAMERSRRPPSHVVLLHLSRQCNCPTLTRRLFSTHPVIAERLSITNQHVPTPWLAVHGEAAGRPMAGEQLVMF